MPPAGAEPANATLRIEGARTLLPSTVRAALASTNGCVTSASRAAAAPVPLIVAPFSASALAAMLTPSASRSPDCTTYSNTSVLPLFAENVACRVAVPIVSATCGLPPVVFTATESSNPARTAIVSPRQYTLSFGAGAANATPSTFGGRPWRPFTLRAESVATAPWARAAWVAVSASWVIVPPFRRTALAAMLAPAGARSPACTV